MSLFGDVGANQPLIRVVSFSAGDIGRGVTAPTESTIGTSPAVPALLFDAVAETGVVVTRFRPDMDLGADMTLRILFALVNGQIDTDQLDLTIDYTVFRTGGGNGPDKASTQLLPTLQVTTANGLAVADVYSIAATIAFDDATNPLNAADAVGISIEVHLTNVTEVAAIHVLDGDLEYNALF